MAKRKRRGSGLKGVLILLILVLLAAIGYMCWMIWGMFSAETAPITVSPTVAAAPTAAVPTETVPPETTVPETTEPETTVPAPTEPFTVSTATILSTGDLLMHSQLITDARQGDGTYDFGYIFPYVTEYVSAADYAVANLETTLGGTAQPYQGNPMFNCPDEIIDAVKAAGFDALLTANNHANDTHAAGYARTLEVVRSKGLKTMGTMLSGDEPKYLIEDINGIRVGMICYTYEDSAIGNSTPALNYNPLKAGGYDILNCFRHSDPEPFYRELEQRMAQMRTDGAEAIVLYIHWGQEYKLEPNANQTSMAQRLCDLGVDVIIGGHPHVVEPVELLSSNTDPGHKTVCLYSMGNAVSNQRNDKISNLPTPHTEDGVLFSITFEKRSDGTVYLSNADLIPTWVRAIDSNGNTVVNSSGYIVKYEILPLEDARRAQWQEQFGINDSTLTQCQESWQRTYDLTGAGMTAVNDYLHTDAFVTYSPAA